MIIDVKSKISYNDLNADMTFRTNYAGIDEIFKYQINIFFDLNDIEYVKNFGENREIYCIGKSKGEDTGLYLKSCTMLDYKIEELYVETLIKFNYFVRIEPSEAISLYRSQKIYEILL